MEVSLSLTTSREPLLLKKVNGPHKWKPCLLSFSLPDRFSQSLFCQPGYRIREDISLKVSSSQKGDVRVVDFRHIIGLAGPPGAGKSTLAFEVAKRVNKLWPEKAPSFDSQVNSPDVAAVIPMDGFHLYRSELDAMENPKEAHERRGAPWTFNPVKLLSCLENLRNQGSVYAPSFDHGVGDPVEDDIFVSLQHKVVIVEGNYLLLEDGVWKEVSSIFDEKWFIDIDIDKAMQRVLRRHISTGKPQDVAKWRIENNDRPNAELIMKSKKSADIIIKSVDFSR
ncbi:Uridine kinase [Quillaja saponaria]|uniref:Uridine kinase n=1 Tax=Quillaja saponaria TaxID=32244 RepID=A0AAD7VEK0_QUISA|nr:Uridine kinase [Quillaja saponaria]